MEAGIAMSNLLHNITSFIMLLLLAGTTAAVSLNDLGTDMVPCYAVGDRCLEIKQARALPCEFLLGLDIANGRPIVWRALSLDDDYDCRTSEEGGCIHAISELSLGSLSNYCCADESAEGTVETWRSRVEQSFSVGEQGAIADTFKYGASDGIYVEEALLGDKVFLPSVADVLRERELAFSSEGPVDDGDVSGVRWWTRSRVAGDSLRAWGVNPQGTLFSCYEGMRLGGRAVINVKKSDVLLSCFGEQKQELCKDVCFSRCLEKPSPCEANDAVVMLLKSERIPNPKCKEWERRGNCVSVWVNVGPVPGKAYLTAAIVSADAQGCWSVEAFGRLAELGDQSFSQRLRMTFPELGSNAVKKELWLFAECEVAGPSEEVSPCPEKIRL